MQSIKEQAIQMISRLPDSAEIDDIMYQLHVISKIRQGQEARNRGDFMTEEQLREEIRKW